MKRIWIWISLAAAVLMAVSSAAGIFASGTYERETAVWAAQAVGQDIANLFVVFPAMLMVLHFAYRGCVRATLVSLGLLIYVVYSYVLYAFFVHFGPWFLAYVAVLGLSAYALFGSVLQTNMDQVSQLLGDNRKMNLASAVLFVFGLLFGFQWLSEIVPALVSGATPKGVAAIGAFVNPIHVLDLAFLLPGMIVTAVSVRKRRPLGLLFALPLLTFAAVMGVAILLMFFAQRAQGIEIPPAPFAVITIVVLTGLFGAYSFSRGITE